LSLSPAPRNPAGPSRQACDGEPRWPQQASGPDMIVSFLALNSEPLLLAAGSTCPHWDEVPPVSCMFDRSNRSSSQVIADTVIEHAEPQGGNRNNA
jgi:hypothetical protein